MDTNWAAEHLQTIRTLMERSALYRRALAPISTFVGCVGIVASIAGWGVKIESPHEFAMYWMVIGFVAIVGALLLVRVQAVKQGENFWSPPMRRVVQAMVPALLVGLVMGLMVLPVEEAKIKAGIAQPIPFELTVIWTLLYGLALNAAGFFMPRGIRLFSWGFVIAGMVLMLLNFRFLDELTPRACNFLMGLLFGASHLAYGVYLYFTERKNEA